MRVYTLEKQTAVTQKTEVVDNKAHAVASQVIREVIIPEIEKEVNQGQNFAPLRQMFYSMILASWYKITLKDALLNQVYSNRGKTGGVLSDDPAVKEKIYQQYLKAYKKGVFNYIKEDVDAVSQQPMPRKYFSGGEKMRLRLGENLAIAHEQSSDDAPLKDGDLAMASVQVAGRAGIDWAMQGNPVNAYEDFYKRFGAMDRDPEETHITQEAVNGFSLKFLTLNAEMLPPSQRRLNETWGVNNEPYGVTEVYFVPEGETQKRMVAFQAELKRLFGNKVYPVDADKLHFTTQGLEQQWDDPAKGTKKPLALHSGLDRIDLNTGAILQVREKARSIETTAVKMQVARLNFNPQTGIFWELRPYLTDPANDPIKQRRRAWGLPEPRPPHITAAYFTQEFTTKEEEELRALLAEYSDVTHFGDILVDDVKVIAYSNFAFNASKYDQGYVVLESVPLKKDAAMNGNELVLRGETGSSVRDLYNASTQAMFQEAVVGFVRAGATHEYRWKYQAEFAGELTANPQTFELGRAMLEDAYSKGVALEGRLDADGWPVDQRFDVAHDVIVEMAKHPELRQRALQLVFDPRTYGMKIDATSEKGFRETQETMGTERQLVAPTVVEPVISVQPEKLSVKRILGKLFGGTSESPVPVVRQQSQVPAVRMKASIHDPKVLGHMRQLVLAVLQEVGNSDLELAGRLIRFRIQLGEWEREAAESERHGRVYEYKAQEVDKLYKYSELLPQLVELANSSHDEEDRGNALMYVVDGYLSTGKSQEAYELFMGVGRVSYYSFARTIAKLVSVSKNRTLILNHLEKIIAHDRLLDWQIDVANELFRQDAKKEAEYLYQKVWDGLSDSGESRLGLLVSLAKGARTTGMKLGKKDAVVLLNDANESVTAALNAWNVRRDRSNNILLRAAQGTAYELTLAGRFSEAEALAELVDKKHRIEYWGGEASHMRPEERDQMYREMVIASAERGDLTQVERYLNLMREYKPGALLEIAKIFARKGEYENSIMASVFGADSVDVRGGIATDKGSRGAMSQMVSFIDQGEPIFEVGKIMLEQGMDTQRVGKTFLAASKVGLGDFQLERLVQVIRDHRELSSLIPEIMQNALRKNASIISHSQHRVILGALREFFPQEASISQEEVNSMFEQAGLGKETAETQSDNGDDKAMTVPIDAGLPELLRNAPVTFSLTPGGALGVELDISLSGKNGQKVFLSVNHNYQLLVSRGLFRAADAIVVKPTDSYLISFDDKNAVEIVWDGKSVVVKNVYPYSTPVFVKRSGFLPEVDSVKQKVIVSNGQETGEVFLDQSFWTKKGGELQIANNKIFLLADGIQVGSRHVRVTAYSDHKEGQKKGELTVQLVDAAMNAPGGIDLNAKNMGLDIAKDGKGIQMKFDPAMVVEFQKGNFTGVEGIILRIVPIQSPLPMLGLETSPVEGALAKG